MASPSPGIDGKLKAGGEHSDSVTVLLTSTGRPQVALAGPLVLLAGIREGPRLVVALGQGAELGRQGRASSAAQRGALCGQDALSPSAPPPRVGRAQILAGAVERRSPLAPGSVCLAGGVWTQVRPEERS